MQPQVPTSPLLRAESSLHHTLDCSPLLQRTHHFPVCVHFLQHPDLEQAVGEHLLGLAVLLLQLPVLAGVLELHATELLLPAVEARGRDVAFTADRFQVFARVGLAQDADDLFGRVSLLLHSRFLSFQTANASCSLAPVRAGNACNTKERTAVNHRGCGDEALKMLFREKLSFRGWFNL